MAALTLALFAACSDSPTDPAATEDSGTSEEDTVVIDLPGDDVDEADVGVDTEHDVPDAAEDVADAGADTADDASDAPDSAPDAGTDTDLDVTTDADAVAVDAGSDATDAPDTVPSDAAADAGVDTDDTGPDVPDVGPDVPDTSDVGSDTLDVGPDVIDVGPDVIDVGPDTPDVGPDVIDVGPDVIDVGPDTVDVGPDVIDVGPDTFDVGLDVIDTTPDAPDVADVRPDVVLDPTPFDDLETLSGDALRDALRDRIDDHIALGYTDARDVMYTDIDVNGGMVECIYTGTRVAADGTRTPGGVINTEHIWPQSWGADSEPMRSDMHHLSPATATSNSARGNTPFGDTSCNQTPACGWYEAGSERGPSSADGSTVFEVRYPRRGDVARAVFYYAVRYDVPVDDTMESALRAWNDADPPSGTERARNDAIETWQSNRNPFVDRPDFVARIADF